MSPRYRVTLTREEHKEIEVMAHFVVYYNNKIITRERSVKMSTWHIRIRSIAFLVAITAILTVGTFAYAADQEKIKIGVIGPMQFQVGKEELAGANMAADEINAAGGITMGGKKYKIELVTANSNEISSISDAVMAMERLITVDKVNFVTGGFLTEPVLAMQDVAADHKMIYIGGAGDPAHTARLAKDYDRYKYYFRAIHTNSISMGESTVILMEKAADQIRKELGISKPKVALVLTKTKVTDEIGNVVTAMAPKLGMELVGIWKTGVKASDYTTELTAIKNAGAQIIGEFLHNPSAVIFSKQWGELQIPAVLVGYSVGAYDKGYWDRTGGMCEYETLYSPYGPAATTDKSMHFWNGYIKRTGDYPGMNSGTYSVIYILKDAIERAGTLKTEAMILALEKTNYVGVMGKYAFFPRDHKWPHELIWGPKHVMLVGVQWQKGELVAIWPDGRPALGDKDWMDVSHEGVKDFQLPPWMIEYWKGKKVK